MRAFIAIAAAVVLATAAGVAAQDPAPGWLAYAMATHSGRLTHMEAKWKVLGTPAEGGAFYSPWFGIESYDNLNLIQPVNPWTGDGWQMYIEYFQWSPEYNFDSDMNSVNTGDVLWGRVDWVAENSSYNVAHTDMNSGWSVEASIPAQTDDSGQPKNFNISYLVFEKDADCSQYPPEGIVTFYDIAISYDGKTITPQWTTGIVDDVCNMRAHVVSPTEVTITWSTSATRKPKKAAARIGSA